MGVRRGRLCVTTAGGGVRLFGGDGVGAGCVGGLGTALAGARLFFGVLCSSRITAVLTSAIWWAPFHSVACIFLILFGLMMAVWRVGACMCMYWKAEASSFPSHILCPRGSVLMCSMRKSMNVLRCASCVLSRERCALSLAMSSRGLSRISVVCRWPHSHSMCCKESSSWDRRGT